MWDALVLNGITLLCLPWLLLARHQNGTGQKILVIQFGKLGDMVCTTPLFRALKTGYPSATITVLCLGRAGELLQGNPCVDEIIMADEAHYRSLSGRLKLLSRLHNEHYDVSIAVLPGTWNAMIGLWTSAPVRLHTSGGRMGLFGKFLHRLHTHRLQYAKGTRTFDHYMNIAKAIGVSAVTYKHEMFISDAESKTAGEWLKERGIGLHQKFAVLSVTAGNRLKEWPLERFVEVARYLVEKHKMHVLFSSAETDITAQATRMLGSSLGVDAGSLKLRPLSAVISKASLFVSVDTGPLYIAHSFDVPLIDIIGPVDPREQPPISSNKVELVLPPGIEPSSFVAETLRISNEEQRKAIDITTVDMVIDAVKRLL